MNKTNTKSFNSIIILVAVLIPFLCSAQIMDFKLLTNRAKTPYIDYYSTGYGAELELSHSNKLSSIRASE